jgi:ABC-2 type transport system permease protein
MRALHAEWTKLRSVPTTGWSVLALVAFTVALSAVVIGGLNASGCPPEEDGCGQDLARLTLSGVYLGQAAVIVLAVLAVTAEYDTGMIRTTLAADPRRGRVFAAKAAVVTATVLAASALSVIGLFAVGRVVLPGNGFTAANGFAPLSLADEPTRRAFAGTVLYFGLIALFSVGIGLAVRHTAGAITSVLSALYVFPVLALIAPDPDLREMIERYAPMPAGLAIQATRDLGDLPVGPWAGLGTLAAYAAAAMVVGGVLFTMRDA